MNMTNEINISNMAKEEIKNSIDWINARTPLSDLQKQYIGFILDQQTKQLQAKIDELENNYSKLLNMSLRMAKMLERANDFNEFMKSNNLPTNK